LLQASETNVAHRIDDQIQTSGGVVYIGRLLVREVAELEFVLVSDDGS